MPKDEFDLEDPLEAVAVELPAEEDTLTPMAECFIEEFMRMGYSAEQILGLFTNPMYAGPLLFTRARGTAAVKQLIAETFMKWGRSSICHPERSEGSQSFAGDTTEILPLRGSGLRQDSQNDRPETTEVDHAQSL